MTLDHGKTPLLKADDGVFTISHCFITHRAPESFWLRLRMAWLVLRGWWQSYELESVVDQEDKKPTVMRVTTKSNVDSGCGWN
jgi:hypothetical protein